MKLKHILPFLLMVGLATQVRAVNFASPYTQSFDSMGTAGTAAPTGWKHLSFNMTTLNTTWQASIPASGTNSVASIAVGAAATTLVASASATPTANQNNGYNAPLSASVTSDRVIATAPTSVTGSGIQVELTNTMGSTLTGLTIAFDTVRYTAPAANELPGYWVFISTDGTTWTNITPNPTIATVPSTVGVTASTLTASGLSIANGATFYLRWMDDNAAQSSPDQIIGLNNVVITTTQPAPVVALTAPTAGASIALPGPVNLSATATDVNGTITKVEFFQGTTKIGEDTDNTDSTYQFAWSGMISGAYSLTAKATDNEGATTTSGAVAITVTNPSNVAPSVSITSPAETATIPASAFTITANAADTDGTVSKVEFFVDTVKIGEDTTAPYSFNWANITAAPHALYAVVTDNDGATATSATVNVTAVAFTDVTSIARGASWKYLDNGTDQGTAWKDTAFDDSTWLSAPAVLGFGDTHIVSTLAMGPASPNQYITYYFRRTFTVANASQVLALKTNLLRDDGAIIYINGVEVARSNMPTGSVNYLTIAPVIVSGADETTYFSIPLPTGALVTGNNVIAVEIHQRDGTSSDLGFDMDLITSIVGGNALPAVSITAPAANATFFSGADIPITATASDTDGTITKVEFFQGVTKLGEDTSGPSYDFTWVAPTAGNYSLTAVATDDVGSTRTSVAVPVTVSAGPSGTLARGPYLNQASQNSIVVRWRTSASVVGRVRYGTAVGSLTQTADQTTAASTDHEVKLTGLTPYTRYYYSFGSTAGDTLGGGDANYTFRTSPTPGTATDTRVWVVGDCGLGSTFQTNVRDAYYAWTGSRAPDACLMLGDNAYNSGTDSEYQTGFYNIYPTMFRKMPLWSCLGNHDANGSSTNPTTNFPYFDMFTFPTAGECGGVASGSEHYFSWDYGNIHFISLDSQTTLANNSPTAPQTVWLQQDLASNTKTWTIVFFHHPIYTKGSHDSDTEGQLITMRTVYGPILEGAGVDLVLNGHSHCYERSVLMDGHYGSSGTLTNAMKLNNGSGRPSGTGAYYKPRTGNTIHSGTVHCVAGSAGQASGGSLNHPVMFVSYNTGGTLNLDINGTTLNGTYVEKGATTGTFTTPDTFTIIKQGALIDSDGDGLSNAFENANGLNRANPADATPALVQNQLLGTSPGSGPVSPVTTAPVVGTNNMSVSFPTQAGLTYQVFYSNDLLTWSPASAPVTGTGSTMSWTDDGTATGTAPNTAGKRFYNVRINNAP